MTDAQIRDAAPALVAALPWVTRLDRPRSCAAPPALAGELPCRYPARWQFRGLPETGADGTYCWLHLLDQLDANPAEGARTLAALAAAQ